MIYSSCLKYQINNEEPQIIKLKDYDWTVALNSNSGVTLETLISFTFLSNFYSPMSEFFIGIPDTARNDTSKIGVFINPLMEPEYPEGNITAKSFNRDLFLNLLLMEFQYSGEPMPSWAEELPNIPNKDLSEFLELKGVIEGLSIEADEMNTLKIIKLTAQEINDINSEEDLLNKLYVDAFQSIAQNALNRLPYIERDSSYEIAELNSSNDTIILKSSVVFGMNKDFALKPYAYSVSDASLLPADKRVVLYLETTDKKTMETKIDPLLPFELNSLLGNMEVEDMFNLGPVPLVLNIMFIGELSSYLGDFYSKNEVRFLHATVRDGKIEDPSISDTDPLVIRYLNNLERLTKGFIYNVEDKEPPGILNYILPLDKTMAKVLTEFLPYIFGMLAQNLESTQLLETYGNPSNWVYEFKPVNVKATRVPIETPSSEFNPSTDMDGYDFFQTYRDIVFTEQPSLDIDSNWVVKYIGDPMPPSPQPPQTPQ